jgi:hypothetical protein
MKRSCCATPTHSRCGAGGRACRTRACGRGDEQRCAWCVLEAGTEQAWQALTPAAAEQQQQQNLHPAPSNARLQRTLSLDPHTHSHTAMLLLPCCCHAAQVPDSARRRAGAPPPPAV